MILYIRIINAFRLYRYSMDTVTSLKTFNPLSNTWRGADRFRCIHARIPFSTEIITHFFRSYIKASAYRYKNFVDGSKLGIVWHSATKLFPPAKNVTLAVNNDELLSDVRTYIIIQYNTTWVFLYINPRALNVNRIILYHVFNRI